MFADRKAVRKVGWLGQYYQINKWNGGKVGLNVVGWVDRKVSVHVSWLG